MAEVWAERGAANAHLGLAMRDVVGGVQLDSGCAFGVPLTPGAERVDVQSSPPQAGARRLKELRAVHGSGCGFLGGLGNRDGALSALRNLAKEAGADYVQLTSTKEPYSDGQCRHNEFVLEGIAYRVAGAPQDSGQDATKAVQRPGAEILSSCAGDSPAVQGKLLRLSGTSCAYLLRSMPDGGDYEVTFDARLASGAAFAIWPDGSWQAGEVRGSAVVVDQARGVLSLVRYAGKEQTQVSKLAWAVDGAWHAWRVARSRSRLTVWLDGKLLLIVLGEPAGQQLGVRTLGGALELRNFGVKPLALAQASALDGLGQGGWRVAVASAAAPVATEPAKQDLTWKDVAALLPRQVGEWRQREVGAVIPLPTVTSMYKKLEGGAGVVVNILVERGKAGGPSFEANDRIDGLPAQVASNTDSTVVRYSDDVVIEVNSYAVDTKAFASALGVKRIGKGVEGVLLRQAKEASKVAVVAPGGGTKPPRMVGECDLDEVDWENRSYPASQLSKKPILLVNGAQRLTSKRVKPDALMTLGQSEQGTELKFSGAYPIELDGEAPPEVMVNVRLTDFGVWHGNSVQEPEPSTEYVFRLGSGCEPELLGAVDLAPSDTSRPEDNALVRIRGSGNRLTREEWRVQDGKFLRTASQSVGREALESPLPPCDEDRSRAQLAGYEGRRGWDVMQGDSCIQRRLKARLGSSYEQFTTYTSMGLSAFELRGDYLVSGGCQIHVCGFHQGAISIHRTTGVVEAVVFELTPKPALAGVKWFTVKGTPLPALKVSVDEGLDRLR